MGKALSITGILLLATVPPYIASLKSQDLVAKVTASDINQLDSIDISSQQIVLIEKVERLRAPIIYGSEYNVPCRRLCQRLVLDGLGGNKGIFVAIRGEIHRYNRNQFQNKGSYYRLENRLHCSQHYAGNVFEVLNETIELAKNGKCIVRYSSSKIPDGLLFDERRLQNDEFVQSNILASTTKTNRLEVSKITDEKKKLLLRSTSIKIRKATYPTYIFAGLSNGFKVFPLFTKFEQKQNPNIVDVLEKITDPNLRKDPNSRRDQRYTFDRYYFELGQSKHQLPAEFTHYFKSPADESFTAP